MKKYILCALFFSIVTTNANALPSNNKWFSGAGQGFVEYRISNDKGQVLTIACNEGAGSTYDHSISLSDSNTTISDNLSIVLDSGPDVDTIIIPEETNSRVGADTWSYFIETINAPFGIPMEIIRNNKIIAEFNPKNHINISEDACTPMFARDDSLPSPSDPTYDNPPKTNFVENPFKVNYQYYEAGLGSHYRIYITSLTDSILLTGVAINRNNCKIHRYDNKLPVQLKFSQSTYVVVPAPCNILEVNISTQNGSMNYTF